MPSGSRDAPGFPQGLQLLCACVNHESPESDINGSITTSTASSSSSNVLKIHRLVDPASLTFPAVCMLARLVSLSVVITLWAFLLLWMLDVMFLSWQVSTPHGLELQLGPLPPGSWITPQQQAGAAAASEQPTRVAMAHCQLAFNRLNKVSRPFPSWNRSISTEIYLCHACSCHEMLRTETAGQDSHPSRSGKLALVPGTRLVLRLRAAEPGAHEPTWLTVRR
eukprot:COSAG01_NODE_1825_length_9137_cov_246.763886_9_plen_223_part_00